MTDIDLIMSCYQWELEGLLEGLALRRVDERENLAELAAKFRYTMHSKKIKQNTLFNKRKEENDIKNIFERKVPQSHGQSSMAERIKAINDYFANK